MLFLSPLDEDDGEAPSKEALPVCTESEVIRPI